MRKISAIIFFFCLIINANAQDKKTLIDNIILLNKSKETVQAVTNYYINQKKSIRQEVPDFVWNKIRNEIDYSIFLNKVHTIFNTNFSITELQKIHSYLKSGDMTKYNTAVKKIDAQLYTEGLFFSKNLGPIVQTKLSQNGF